MAAQDARKPLTSMASSARGSSLRRGGATARVGLWSAAVKAETSASQAAASVASVR